MGIKLCHLAPWSLMRDAENDFEFVEAAWCSYKPYRDHFSYDRPPLQADKELVLDNSVHLLGRPMPGGYLTGLVHLFREHYMGVTVVVPDVKNNMKETIRLGCSFIAEYSGHIPRHIRFMLVGQGTDREEWATCLDNLKGCANAYSSGRPVTVGLPYIMCWPGMNPLRTRISACQYVTDNPGDVDRIHFLGHQEPKDMLTLSQWSSESVTLYHDTSAAYVYALKGLSVRDSVLEHETKPIELLSQDGFWFRSLWLENMSMLRCYCG